MSFCTHNRGADLEIARCVLQCIGGIGRWGAWVVALVAALCLAASATAQPSRSSPTLGRTLRAGAPASFARPLPPPLRFERIANLPGALRLSSGLVLPRVALTDLAPRLSDQPELPRAHGIFDGGRVGALRIIDRAWQQVLGRENAVTIEPGRTEGETLYTVRMGTRIGLIGGNVRGGAAAYSVRMVVRDGTLVSAWPVAAGSQEAIGNAETRHWSLPWPAYESPRREHPERARTMGEITRDLTEHYLLLPEEARRAAPHLRLGMPTPASLRARDDLLVVRRGYVASYQENTRNPNWVSFRITRADVVARPEDHVRSDAFRADLRLPISVRRAHPDDYRRSDFTRGHLVPSGARQSARHTNSETFLMTNIVPQTAESNSGAWRHLEHYIRAQVRAGLVAQVLAGPSYRGNARTIGESEVGVPDSLWMVVVLLRPGQSLRTIRPDTTRVIALNVPNTREVTLDANDYRTSVQEIEALTGFQFFTNLPGDLAAALRTRATSESFGTPPATYRAENR